MATFVLVHGAWQGAWCWFKVTPLLQQAGHTVVAVDLPSHGIDRTPTQAVTLELYAESICRVLDASSHPVVLVGHSMGGAVISRTAELRPARIDRLIYVAAFLLANGQTMRDVSPPGSAGPAPSDMTLTEDGTAAFMKPESAARLFFADCSAEDQALAHALLVPQTLTITTTRMAISDERFGSIPKFYIECTQDQAISLENQRAMQSTVGCRRVATMETSHSPFLSSPARLADHMMETLGI